MLTKEITDFLQQKKLIVATSGGVDSMVLVSLLLNNPQISKTNLIIAHFDHKIRPESKNDADFVKIFCQRNKLKFKLNSADIKKITKVNKTNLEATARNYRYQFLEKLRQETDSDLILTAHHQDDNLETVIMNWQRGTGLFGLSGIKKLDRKTKIYRPLLNFTKSQILNYATKQQINHITDLSNYDLNFRRNYIRHELISDLKSWKTDYKETVLELIELANICQWNLLYSFIDLNLNIDDNKLIFNKIEFANLPEYKINHFLIFIIRHFQVQTNKHQLLILKNNIKNKAGNKLCLIGKLTFQTKGKSILLNSKV